ncbi:unnamed protein product [Rotaria sp. Silwood1]|nr:unnamed protein product [Rotaria sp. Silwood1]
MKKPYYNARTEQWMTILQQYDMILQHISGKENTTADTLSRYPVDKPDAYDEDAPRLVTSSTQTEDLFVNVVTTCSMTRQQPSPVSCTTISSSSPSSRTTTPPATSQSIPPVTSFSSSLNDIKILFDHDALNQHQNQDPVIQKTKIVSPLNSKYTLDDHNILYKIITRKNGHILQLPYVLASLIPQILFTYHNSTFNDGHFGFIDTCAHDICAPTRPHRHIRARHFRT